MHGFFAGLIIGLSVAIGPGFLLTVFGTILINRKLKHSRVKRLKRRFFIQNRGQLLQQLVAHRAGIAEKMIIPLEELEKATNNFDRTRQVGVGGHGIVYKGILSDLHVVAIKRSKIVLQREIDEFINEVAILSQINHKNVVKLYGCCLETEVPLLAYEFISNGTLSDHLHGESSRSIPWKDRLRIASEVGKAISYLHSAVLIPILHRDIKSSNILLDDALTAKVSDFGTSRYIPMDHTGITTTAVQGTRGYLDPMYCYTGRLSEKSDVYSFGVLLIEMLTRKIPNMCENEGLVSKFVELISEGKMLEILDPQVVEEGGGEVEEVVALTVTCIKLREEERPTMRQVEMTLEGLQATNGRIMDDLGEKNSAEHYVTMSYLATRRSNSLQDVRQQYCPQVDFSMPVRYTS
jgi:serine/threonine protein kinase